MSKLAIIARHGLEWYKAWREREKAKQYAWLSENRERRREVSRVWDAAHCDEINARRRAARAAKPGARRLESRINAHRRRSGGRPSKAAVEFLLSQPCLDCGATDRIEVGHLIPVANGGTNHPLNLVAQCRSCNAKQNRKVHPRAMMVHYPTLAAMAA